jgi:hypothetical protein
MIALDAFFYSGFGGLDDERENKNGVEPEDDEG